MTPEQLDELEAHAEGRILTGDEAREELVRVIGLLREAREVLGLILSADALQHWAFKADDDGESIYDMVRRAAGRKPL